MFKQYTELKAQHADKILLFRVGDFYEVFGCDAETLHRDLGITITTRTDASGTMKMAGFPHHQLEAYLHKLLKIGRKVAICEAVDEYGAHALGTAAKTVTTRIEKPAEPVTAPRRFTLRDLAAEKRNMLAWLNQDGAPPVASVSPGGKSYSSWMRMKVATPVTDLATLDAWWADYRHDLATDFQKSALNLHKQLTRAQFIDECLRLGCGLKRGGTVKERVQRAAQARPDRYTTNATAVAATGAA